MQRIIGVIIGGICGGFLGFNKIGHIGFIPGIIVGAVAGFYVPEVATIVSNLLQYL